jgi:2-amino-4-hydroxy-6-hydroxymethyldihydropteridine diphosphokinase
VAEDFLSERSHHGEVSVGGEQDLYYKGLASIYAGALEYTEWAPQYARIRAEFGFPFPREERAADLLASLLPEAARSDPLGRIGARIAGRDAIVLGLAPDSGPPPLWRLPPTTPAPVLIAADGATATCLEAGLVPSVIVTDLDGPVPALITANRRGALVVIHAHGDNLGPLEEWVPQFPGELAGSWAGPPRPDLIDVGGFTDGDRAAYLAAHVGASRVLLWGFDFERVNEREPNGATRKLAKLRWARTLLANLAVEGRVPLLVFERDGRLVPYPDGKSMASTR